MEQEQVDQLESLTIEHIDDQKPESGYAIAYVKARLFHTFGDRFKFRIRSELSKCTRVEIWIRFEGDNKA